MRNAATALAAPIGQTYPPRLERPMEAGASAGGTGMGNVTACSGWIAGAPSAGGGELGALGLMISVAPAAPAAPSTLALRSSMIPAIAARRRSILGQMSRRT